MRTDCVPHRLVLLLYSFPDLACTCINNKQLSRWPLCTIDANMSYCCVRPNWFLSLFWSANFTFPDIYFKNFIAYLLQHELVWQPAIIYPPVFLSTHPSVDHPTCLSIYWLVLMMNEVSWNRPPALYICDVLHSPVVFHLLMTVCRLALKDRNGHFSSPSSVPDFNSWVF